jgi:hypothetical protein
MGTSTRLTTISPKANGRFVGSTWVESHGTGGERGILATFCKSFRADSLSYLGMGYWWGNTS